MTAYSVAEAKNTLPKLIDRALHGEEVVITRHGKPVAELRSVRPPPAPPRGTMVASRRDAWEAMKRPETRSKTITRAAISAR